MRTNPFLDTFLFLIGRTPDHQNSGVGPLLTVLFLVLLIASLVIARRNWLIDSAQRTSEHLVRWFMRVMIGCMWLQGSLWKLPLPVSGGLKFWTEEEGRYAAFEAHKWFATHVMVPGLPVLNSLVYLTELSLAVSFMLGLFVRPMAIVGILSAGNMLVIQLLTARQKVQEIGMIQAMGMDQGLLLQVFLTEAVLVWLFGLLVAVGLLIPGILISVRILAEEPAQRDLWFHLPWLYRVGLAGFALLISVLCTGFATMWTIRSSPVQNLSREY